MSERASLEELIEFANKVREAGGGNPLDALMPSVPGDTQQCLIAKNLNFNCEVDGDGPNGEWTMHVESAETAKDIADSLGLELHDPYEDDYFNTVILPPEIGEVARVFDSVDAFLNDRKDGRHAPPEEYEITEEDIHDILPYIEESRKEAYKNASIINDDGSIVL